jgi:hypothetical protein
VSSAALVQSILEEHNHSRQGRVVAVAGPKTSGHKVGEWGDQNNMIVTRLGTLLDPLSREDDLTSLVLMVFAFIMYAIAYLIARCGDDESSFFLVLVPDNHRSCFLWSSSWLARMSCYKD